MEDRIKRLEDSVNMLATLVGEMHIEVNVMKTILATEISAINGNISSDEAVEHIDKFCKERIAEAHAYAASNTTKGKKIN